MSYYDQNNTCQQMIWDGSCPNYTTSPTWDPCYKEDKEEKCCVDACRKECECECKNKCEYECKNKCECECKHECECKKKCECECECECKHKSECDKHDKYEKGASAQFVSGINVTSPSSGQEIIGYWPLGNVQPVEVGITAVADGRKIQLSGPSTIILQPGRYAVDSHVLVANFDNFDPQGSDPIVTKLFLNGVPLDYTVNSINVINQLFVINSTQLNKNNIITVTQPNTTLQWMAGNTVSLDFHFELYEASMTIIEL